MVYALALRVKDQKSGLAPDPLRTTDRSVQPFTMAERSSNHGDGHRQDINRTPIGQKQDDTIDS
jgi:hypothetical protein